MCCDAPAPLGCHALGKAGEGLRHPVGCVAETVRTAPAGKLAAVVRRAWAGWVLRWAVSAGRAGRGRWRGDGEDLRSKLIGRLGH
jgi:hypothetical protein